MWSFAGLRSLPPEIEFLHALQTLKADHNALPFLPPEVGRLTCLTSLSLRHNLLAAFPAEAVSLCRVRALHLDHNAFVALPPSLQGFTVSARRARNQMYRGLVTCCLRGS